jgi:hypothetical protein
MHLLWLWLGTNYPVPHLLFSLAAARTANGSPVRSDTHTPSPPLRPPPPPKQQQPSPLDIEAAGVPPPPKVDPYLKSRLDKFYAQLEVGAAAVAACVVCVCVCLCVLVCACVCARAAGSAPNARGFSKHLAPCLWGIRSPERERAGSSCQRAALQRGWVPSRQRA